MSTESHIIERCRALHSWRTDDHTRTLIAFHATTGIPFCEECADWHHVGEEHSGTDLDR